MKTIISTLVFFLFSSHFTYSQESIENSIINERIESISIKIKEFQNNIKEIQIKIDEISYKHQSTESKDILILQKEKSYYVDEINKLKAQKMALTESEDKKNKTQ